MTQYLKPTVKPEGKEPLFVALKRINRNIEEQGRANFNSFIAVDYFLYDGMEKGVGQEKAQELHRDLWRKYPPHWVKNAKDALNVGEVKDLSEAGKIIEFCQKTRFCDFNVKEASKDELVGEITICPFVEVTQNTFGVKAEDNYFKSVYHTTHAFIDEIVKQAGLGYEVEIKVETAMCRGDKSCKVVCVKK